jgi:DNA polymerase-3 subunit epsilon
VKLLFLDTETTGLDDRKHGIVQIAGLVDIDGDVKEEFNFHCNICPGQEIDAKASEVNGLTADMIKEYPPAVEVYQKVLKIFDKYINRYDKTDKFYLVGQNIQFDYKFMNKWFYNHGNQYLYSYIHYHKIDIITLSAMLTVSGLMKTNNMKLASVAEFFGIPLKAHDALEDILACRSIFYKFSDMLRNVR